jgi:putative transposase
LANRYDAIILENLNVEGMKKLGKGHAKSVTLDFSWSDFVNILKYKMEERGKHLILVDRWFPSSKLCSHCGYKNKELKLENREWDCPECDTHHDRDKNASQNLLKEGIKTLQSLGIMIQPTVGTTESHAWEDRVRHVTTNAVVDDPRIHPL